MHKTITKEKICKEVLISNGIPVSRFTSNEGMIKRIFNFYETEYHDYSLAKTAEYFLRSIGEAPIGYCLIRYLGKYDARVIDIILTVFSEKEVVNIITDWIVQEKNILSIGKIYSKLQDSCLGLAISFFDYDRLIENVNAAIEKSVNAIISKTKANEAEREMVLYHHLTEDLHYDFYFDYLEEISHSYDFVKELIGEELALKTFRELLILKKRTIKNQMWSWNKFYSKHKDVIKEVIDWMGEKGNVLTENDEQLKRLFFDMIINNDATW